MIVRKLQEKLEKRLGESPAVALLGPRQTGKTTLAIELAKQYPSIYLDLESESDLSKLSDAELYLPKHEDKLVILDEIHRKPELFQSLRGLIDKGRRKGLKSGRFLILGSASRDLLKQSSESLAGRISYLELSPFSVEEVDSNLHERLWIRGGFPESFLAQNDEVSLRWRRDFIRTYLERDIPQLGPRRIAAETLRRFWTMLAHCQGGLHNASVLARGLGVDGKTVAGYLDLFVDLMLVRRLEPWHRNVGKRLVKSPKIYIRDTGLLHALLGLMDEDTLLGHTIVGNSWESFVIENLIAAIPEEAETHFYRTSAGAEVDLVLTLPQGIVCAIEIKRSLSPTVTKGFQLGCLDLKADKRFIVYPGEERYPLSHETEAIGLQELATLIACI